MLGDSGSSVLGSSGDAVAEHMAAAAVPAHDSPDVGGVGSNSGEEDKGTYKGDEGDRSYGGNRWPRQETLALLKIRSDMDLAFKDASVKGPLWEDVSRKLAELGYHRSAKKCKEKFENVYKYHKRTKEGRTGKSDGKTYRFFDQLEALETHPSHIQSSTPVKPHQNIVPTTVASTATSTAMRPLSITPSLPAQITVTSVSHSTMNMSQAGIKVSPAVNLTIPSFPLTNPTILPPPPPPTTTNPSHNASIRSSFPNISTDLLSNSTSSSTFSDEELQLRRKRKRKWKDFFERLMKEVIQKQEELQKKFLDAIEKREHERMIREESWRMQEISRINKEREILAQERSLAAAKDAAVMTFLQKISEQQNPGQAFQYNPPEPQPAVQPAPPPAPQPALVAVTQPAPVSAPATVLPPHTVTGFEIQKFDNGENCTPTSSSRWPKVEVQALINLRTNLDAKYQDNGPKGPLWEEISAAMRKIGYNRSAKRCKEKWENINKYFKKVKESNKKRPEDSKTCPYFHQLDALYREKNKFENPSSTTQVLKLGNSTNMVPLMVRPEQQWPPQQEQLSDDAAMDDVESEPMDQNQEEGDKEGDEEEEEEEEEEDGAGNFEIVASKPANSIGAVE